MSEWRSAEPWLTHPAAAAGVRNNELDPTAVREQTATRVWQTRRRWKTSPQRHGPSSLARVRISLAIADERAIRVPVQTATVTQEGEATLEPGPLRPRQRTSGALMSGVPLALYVTRRADG